VDKLGQQSAIGGDFIATKQLKLAQIGPTHQVWQLASGDSSSETVWRRTSSSLAKFVFKLTKPKHWEENWAAIWAKLGKICTFGKLPKLIRTYLNLFCHIKLLIWNSEPLKIGEKQKG